MLEAFFDNPGNMIAIGVAIMTFATVLTLAQPMFKGDQLDARMKLVANRREELRRASRAQLAARDGAGLRHAEGNVTKRVVERLQLSKLLEDPKLVDSLAQAGYRGPKPLQVFYFFRFVTPFVLAVVVGLYVNVLNPLHWPIAPRLCATFMAFGLGFYLPTLVLKNRIGKRAASVNGAFPDALDLLLICVESGMSVEAALQKVGMEVGTASVELAEELSLLTAELSYLPERRMAYEGLARRNTHPGVKAVVTAMIQAERYGTPLGSALRVMAKENREMRLAAAEKKAAQLPAKLTVPMIVFFLPVLFIVILQPALSRALGKHPAPASASASS
ncbi:MAG: type II secretion system F family protein [Caulobacteraceae bacterium]|nr:type II secretion system F family protein [Caulobacter sp.]